MSPQNINIFDKLVACDPQPSIFFIQLKIDSHQMLNFHLILPESFEQFFFNIGPVDVNRFLNRHFDRDLNRDLSVNMNWNFTIYVDWFIHINYFLCDCRYLNRLNDFFLNFEWNFLLNLNVFWNLYNLLNDSFRPWNCPWNLH